MKKSIVNGLFVLLLLAACKKNSVEQKIVETIPPFDIVSEECYRAVQKKDTISMSLIRKGNQLQAGKLSYNYFEKDQNEGTLAGTFHGDTLVAKYSFRSEGIISVREVIFLKQGRSYIEGFGPVAENPNGEVVFQNLKVIQFNDILPLLEVSCKD